MKLNFVKERRWRKKNLKKSSCFVFFFKHTIRLYNNPGALVVWREGKGKQQDKSKEISYLNIHDFFCFSEGRRRRRNKTRIIKIKWKESFPGEGSRASGIFTVCNHDYWLLTVKLFNLINTLIEWQANNEIKQTSPEFGLKLPRKSKSGGDFVAELAREALNLIKSFTGNRSSRKLERFAPVMTPDVLCETDVEGAVTFFAIWSDVDDEALFDDGFGWSMVICAFSLATIVVSALRDCPRERCCGNEAFWSLDATLNVFCVPFMIEFP